MHVLSESFAIGSKTFKQLLLLNLLGWHVIEPESCLAFTNSIWSFGLTHPHKSYIIQDGVMGTRDEETRRFFKHSSVQVLLCPRSAGKRHSFVKQQVTTVQWSIFFFFACIIKSTAAFCYAWFLCSSQSMYVCHAVWHRPKVDLAMG